MTTIFNKIDVANTATASAFVFNNPTFNLTLDSADQTVGTSTITIPNQKGVDAELMTNVVSTTQTTTAAVTPIITIPTSTNTAYTVDVLITAYATGSNEVLSTKLLISARNDSGTLTIVGDPMTIIADVLEWDIDTAVSGSNILVNATGAAATIINWNASYRLQTTA